MVQVFFMIVGPMFILLIIGVKIEHYLKRDLPDRGKELREHFKEMEKHNDT